MKGTIFIVNAKRERETGMSLVPQGISECKVSKKAERSRTEQTEEEKCGWRFMPTKKSKFS